MLALLSLAAPMHGVSAQPNSVTAHGSTSAEDEQRITDLVLANHILAAQGVMDAFGHVSVRSAAHPDHYFMSGSRSPALVERTDILEFDADGHPVRPLPPGVRLFGEQAIHTALYRARADAQAVVHAHAQAVLPFTITTAPFRAAIHQATFLGAQPIPVFDDRDGPQHRGEMLVTTPVQGAALARAMAGRLMVLMRGHGFSLVAPSLRGVVFEAIYAVQNATTLSTAAMLGPIDYLTPEEVARMPDSTSDAIVTRPWQAWTAQAQAQVQGSAPRMR